MSYVRRVCCFEPYTRTQSVRLVVHGKHGTPRAIQIALAVGIFFIFGRIDGAMLNRK